MQTANDNSALAPKAKGSTNTSPAKSDGHSAKPKPSTMGRAKTWPEIVSAPKEQDGARLLECISATVSHYMVIDSPLADTVALWCVMTWIHPRLDVAPFLNLTGPTKRVGKSTLLEIVSTFVRKPMPVSSAITEAVLSRIVSEHEPTLCLDEVDLYLSENPTLRAMLNGSQRKELAVRLTNVPVGDSWVVHEFSTWCPKLLSGIGELPDTVRDRSIEVRLERAKPEERRPRWRDRDTSQIGAFPRRLLRWIEDNGDAILAGRSNIKYPNELHARARDSWESLLAIADQAGGEWPTRARIAAVAASTGTTALGVPDSERIVTDVHRVFLGAGLPESLPTDSIADRLHEMDDAPWSEFGKGNAGLTPNKLARLLKPYNVRPVKFRVKTATHRGYHLRDLAPVFDRYSTADCSTLAGACSTLENTSGTEKHNKINDVAVVPLVEGGGAEPWLRVVA